MKYYKKNIKVSIILPVHKQLNLFKKALESLINQSLKDIEILIYSDGNNNFFNKKVISFIRPYSNIKFFSQRKKKGISYGLNFLINKSNGEYIARMDADDISFKERIKKQLFCAKRYGKNYIITSGCIYFNDDLRNEEYIPKKVNLNILKKNNPLIHPTLFAHRDIFKKILYRNIFLAEDYDFYYRAIKHGYKFKIMKEALILYRVKKKMNILSYYLLIYSILKLRDTFVRDNILNIRAYSENLAEHKKKFNERIFNYYNTLYYYTVLKKNLFIRIYNLIKIIFKDKFLFKYIILRRFSFNFREKKIKNINHNPKPLFNKNVELVSVIVPTRNSGKTIKKTINSILKQDYKNIEIIVVDDGSTDNTLEILKEFANKIFLVLLDKKVLAGEARNEGIKKSNGNFIAFCDSDDFWFANKISKQVDYLIKNNYKIVCSNALSLKDKKIKKMYINFEYQEITTLDLFSKNYVINSSVLIKKEILNKSKLYPTSKYFFSYEDYYSWINISMRHKIGFFDQDLLIYTDNPRFSSRHNSLPFYIIKLRILFYFFINCLIFKIKPIYILTILKVYCVDLFRYIINNK